MTERPRVGISRCLLGDKVRYDGTHKRDGSLIEALSGDVEWVPVCPEVEVGMGTPREPIHLVAMSDGVRSGEECVTLLGVGTGEDWTDRMTQWTRQRVQELQALNLSGFILKARSPSCGVRGVPIRPPSLRFGAAGNPGSTGRGLFAQALLDAMPELPIADEEELGDSSARERFRVRILMYRNRESAHEPSGENAEG